MNTATGDHMFQGEHAPTACMREQACSFRRLRAQSMHFTKIIFRQLLSLLQVSHAQDLFLGALHPESIRVSWVRRMQGGYYPQLRVCRAGYLHEAAGLEVGPPFTRLLCCSCIRPCCTTAFFIPVVFHDSLLEFVLTQVLETDGSSGRYPVLAGWTQQQRLRILWDTGGGHRIRAMLPAALHAA